MVNQLVLDGFILQHFHFIQHPHIRFYSGDDDCHELNYKWEVKWIHIHGPLPTTDVAVPIPGGLHTDWIVPEILYQIHIQDDSLITKCKYTLPGKYSRGT